ncbi:hypothetical protein ACSSZE_11725 [Acidithiobacillus caldus]
MSLIRSEPQGGATRPQTTLSALERVLIDASRVEQALRSIGGKGRGLHELCSSLGRILPPGLSNTIHQIARVRNRAAHEADRFRIGKGELRQYEHHCRWVLRELGRIERWRGPRKPRGPWYHTQWRQHRLGRATVFLHILLVLAVFTVPLGAAILLIQHGAWIDAVASAAVAALSAGILAYRRIVSLPILGLVLMGPLAALLAIPSPGNAPAAYLALLLGSWLLAATSA